MERVFFVVGVALLSLTTRMGAIEHPVPLEKGTTDAKCIDCHDDKTKGKFVHSAIAMGCSACHEVKIEPDKTTITLNLPKEELCLTCHEKSANKVQHGPYSAGACVRCHDPHESDFPKQLRAEVTDLCMSCHALDRPTVKWDPKGKAISMLGNQALTLDEYQKAPKIGLDKKNPKGHPIMGHPVTGIDPRDKDKKAQFSCLACHQPHSSEVAKLMPKGVKDTLSVCELCHTN